MSELKKCWVESSNDPEGPFPLNNLPMGVFIDADGGRHICSAIGSYVVDLSELEIAGLIDAGGSLKGETLNSFMALGSDAWSLLRRDLTRLLEAGGDNTLRHDETLRERAFRRHEDVTMALPFEVREFTDFYSGRNHAQNVGEMFRGFENALPPNWLHMPIAYNGRASTVVVSGTDIVRPSGQMMPPGGDAPVFGPCQWLDIELEMGVVIGQPSAMGERVDTARAREMVFGFCLLNDWSARDIQAWEYQPLGPFQSKAFATTISPWIVMRAALEPFLTSGQESEVPLLDHLTEEGPGFYDIDLEIGLQPEGSTESTIARTNASELTYSAAQQLAHHTTCGCAMRVGDLLGTGTISGPTADSRGCLLELSWGGKEPVLLANGASRTFLADGDTVILRGVARGDGYSIGFGECAGTVLPAV